MTLAGETAADLMRPNPVSIRDRATVLEAAALLTDKGFSGAPVIDDAGRPIGVVTRSDLLAHDRERVEYAASVPDYYAEEDRAQVPKGLPGSGFQVVNVDRTCVSEIMTPVVFSVTPHTPVRKVVTELLSLQVHRLFVVNEYGILVGVISASDVLRHLH
jgi:CBS domain-containing protein